MHIAARAHTFYHGLFQPKPRALALAAYRDIETRLQAAGIADEDRRMALAREIANVAAFSIDPDYPRDRLAAIHRFAEDVFETEGFLKLPDFDWTTKHSIAEYWELQDRLRRIRLHTDDIAKTKELVGQTFIRALEPLITASPKITGLSGARSITVPTELIHTIADLPAVVDKIASAWFSDDNLKLELFAQIRDQLEGNLIAASGGNPADRENFNRQPKFPLKSDIANPEELAATYLNGTPALGLFQQTLDFAIPEAVRFEHHHIVAGSGHGKTQTLQYLIAEDLKAVAEGNRSIVVIDSQGDLIRRISHLKVFAPGQPLHERLVLIDPTDVEWPVSLNLFDVGLQRLDSYSKLERERLINSILELYDFVLGSLLSAEMTQKQNVIFRYVTRLMFHVPNATIQTLRELMEPKSEIKFARYIDTLSGSAKAFFHTEFGTSEFAQTRRQVLRRLWGIFENQNFERMFSHPRSKLDLYKEMNSGKVILINTAKDLLKESGTEIFGRFFIALIAQAAQERATLRERDRMPTMVYIDEAADYFDRNVGIILSQARKYNVGMVLAHQYMGQLDPKLYEAIAANTSIKFAGGVSNKDARQLAPMMGCTPELIESQPKLSFASYLRGITKAAIPLQFPLAYMEAMPTMSAADFRVLRQKMRDRYAVHYNELDKAGTSVEGKEGGEVSSNPDKARDGSTRVQRPAENDLRQSKEGDDGIADDW